jgi:hypothetical protein
VVVTVGSAERVRWGDWGEAAIPAFRYTHPRTGADVEIRQAVRVPLDLPFDLRIGARVALVCRGVMPSGMLRHPVLLSPTLTSPIARSVSIEPGKEERGRP